MPVATRGAEAGPPADCAVLDASEYQALKGELRELKLECATARGGRKPGQRVSGAMPTLPVLLWLVGDQNSRTDTPVAAPPPPPATTRLQTYRLQTHRLPARCPYHCSWSRRWCVPHGRRGQHGKRSS